MDTSEQSPDSPQLGLSVAEVLAFAEAAGIEGVDQSALMDFALAIAEECAEIGDRYTDGENSCGDDIRARFGLG